MNGEALLYLFSCFWLAILLLTMISFAMMFYDLECDYIRPHILCNKLNQFILPEMGGHAFLFFLLLINGHWPSALLNLPLVAYNAKKVMDGRQLLDATEIFRTLNQHKKECFIKIAFYFLSFFFFMFRMIMSFIYVTA